MNYPDAQDKDSLEVGATFQDFVSRELAHFGIPITYYVSRRYQQNIGESVQGIEIKLDRLCTKTGRLSIETAEKTKALNDDWIPSGIYRNDNTWLYVQGNSEILYLFAKNVLIQLHKMGKYATHEEPTIQAFFLPLADADIWCAKKIKPFFGVPNQSR